MTILIQPPTAAALQALGGGDNRSQDSGAGVNTSGAVVQACFGSVASPDTGTNPVIKVTRTMSLFGHQVFADGHEQACAVEVLAYGDANNQVQTVGLSGAANNAGTINDAGRFPDALGVQGKAVITGAGTGRAIGLVGTGQSSSPSIAGLDGAQLFARNDTGLDGVVSATGQSKYRGLSIYALGANKGSAGIELVGPSSTTGHQFDVGIHLGGQVAGPARVDANCQTTAGSAVVLDPNCIAADFNSTVSGAGIPVNVVITAVTPGVSFTMSAAATATANPVALSIQLQGPAFTAGIQDDCDAQYGYLITANANHQKAAIAIAAGAGGIVIGATAFFTTATLLDVRAANASARPLVRWGNAANAQDYSQIFSNSGGIYELFVAQSALLVGVAAGDGGLKISTAAKFFHIGGTQSVVKVGNDNSLVLQGAVATPAGGSAAASVGLGSGPGPGIFFGSGVPTVSAPQGSIYLRSDGSTTATRMYVSTGAGTWTNVVTAA